MKTHRQLIPFSPILSNRTQYINYFVSHILEFQLYRAMCNASGQYVPGDPKRPLHDCDFEGSEIVGDKMRAGLRLGLSKHWKESLKEFTGEDDLSADAVLEYFDPLYKFLQAHNAGNARQRKKESER